MTNLIGELLPLAIGIALSPVPVVAQILMLFGKRARSNGLAFMFGWVIPLAIWGIIFLVAGNAGKSGSGDTTNAISSVIKLLLGFLFLYLAYRSWKSRPEPGEEPKLPAWMATLDSFSTGKSFGFAALLSGTNPKNVGLLAAACNLITQSNLTGAQPWIVLVVFVIVACFSVIVPVLFYFVAGASAEKTLTVWKTWLSANNSTVMFILLLIFGVKLVGAGFGGL
jgi:threonine/homoserine/homoserine lactone efflux protein